MTVRHKRQSVRFLIRLGLGLYYILVALSALIVAAYVAYRLLVRTPLVPGPVGPDISQSQGSVSSSTGQGDVSGAGDISQGDVSNQGPDEPERREQVWTFLLVGTDDGNGNADTLMVASYDVKERRVGVVSIPRDTIVDRSWSTYPKINAAYSKGIKCVREEVSQLLGIPIDYYIKIDIKAFVALVDEVEGIDFNVPVDMDYDDPAQNLSIHYKKGMQHLNGQQALEVVRFRHNNDMSGYSDVGRSQTQQAILTAVAKKVLSWGSVPKISKFMDIFASYVDTDLSASDMVYFATQTLYMDLKTGLTTKTLKGRGDATYNEFTWCYELDKEQTLADINALLNPYTTPITKEMVHIVTADSYAT